jgi:glyoxylase-like metal-dependent hydrolase (beta-lactamase superfamily II)
MHFGKALLAIASVAIAQTPAPAPPPAPFVTHQLGPNLYWIAGGGGNSGVIVGKKGVIVIDAKTTLAGGKELLDDIAKITSKPVTTVIETHSDSDHIIGVSAFPKGIAIIATESTKEGRRSRSRRRPERPSGRLSPYAGLVEEPANPEDRRRQAGPVPLGARAYQRRSGGLSARG